MLALVPVIGPTLAIATIASWHIIRVLLFVLPPCDPAASMIPWISLAVYVLAF
ncbi:MAG TPA: hypothetical protein VEG44_00190 [Candidatus Acidoferrales bacterium]|nr:hypothetical protein [Candidatus Acidoferrales bacterium]